MTLKICGTILLFFLLAAALEANTRKEAYTVAMLDFEVKDRNLSDLKDKIMDLTAFELSSHPRFSLVERQRLDKILQELGLGLSGLTDEAQACKAGYLAGAEILATGSIFVEDGELVVVTKIIGTETSRVYGETVRVPFSGEITPRLDKLAGRIAAIIAEEGAPVVAGSVKSGRKTVALINLRSVTGDDNLASWGEDLTSELTVRLSKRKEFSLVERVSIDKVLKEIFLSKYGYVSPQDAIKAGKILGAEIMVLPLSIPLSRDTLRIDVLFVDPRTSRIMGAVTLGAPREKPRAAGKKLMNKIENKLISLTREE